MQSKVLESSYKIRENCRLCGSKDIKTAFSMAPIPQGDAYLPYERRHETNELFPNDIMLCSTCGNLQTGIDVNVDSIYENYLWTTSASPGLVASYKAYVDDVVTRFFPSGAQKKFAVEFGSNDGTFVKLLKDKGMNVLAVEPAKNLAIRSNNDGIETINDFFNPQLALSIKEEKGQADLIIGNHVFPNSNDVEPIAEAIKQLLDKNGVAVIQVFYLYDVIKSDLLENFNHEHLSYLYVRPLQNLFSRYGMTLFDVQHVATKGGSIRCFIQHKDGPHKITPAVDQFIKQEEELGLHRLEIYQTVNEKIKELKQNFKSFFENCKSQNKTIAAYGTSIGATVFTYQYDLGKHIQFFVDDDPVRHGLVTPGHHLPVKAPDYIYEAKPDYIVVMAPLYADNIIGKHKKFLEQGGHFVKFRPKFEIV